MATTDLLPYLVAAGASGTGLGTLTLNVGANSGPNQAWPVLPGDQVIVTGGAGSHIPTGVTDTQGHTYTAVVSNASGQATWQFQATATHGLCSLNPSTGLTDSITVTWAVTTDAHRIIVMACPAMQAAPLDGTPVSATGVGGGGTGTSPTVTTNALAGVGNGGNGELIVATICNGDTGGAPQWPAGWTVIGQAHNTGSVWCTTAVRNQTGTAAVTVSPTLAASVTWTMTVSAYKPLIVSPKDLVGASVFKSTYSNPGTRVGNSGQFDVFANAGSTVPRHWGLQAGRIYYPEDRWPSDAGNGINTPEEFGNLIDAGIFVLVTFRGNRAVGGGTTASRASLINSITLMKNYVASKGAGTPKFMLSTWNEIGGNGTSGDFGDGTQASNGVTQPSPFGAPGTVSTPQMNLNAQQHAQFYNPVAVGNAGLGGCGVPLYYSTQLFSPAAATACFPGRQYVNIHGPDFYASNWTGVHQATLDACITQAETQTPPLPVAIPEMGVSSGGTVNITGPNSFDLWIRQQVVAKLLAHMNAGYHIGPTVWWTMNNTGPNAVTASTPVAELTDLQYWWDSLNPPAAGALQITTASLVSGTVGATYSQTLTASGAVGSLTWSATGLPAGISLNASTGALTGAPTASGSFTVAVTVTDSTGPQAFNSYPLTIAAGAGPAIGTASLVNATQGSTYSAPVTASGGSTPYSWAATGLPAGLSIAASGTPTTNITGTPTAAGQFSVTITVTDNSSRQAVTTLGLFVTGVVVINSPSPPGGTQGSAYSFTATATGGSGSYTWAATGLPAGLSIASGTGAISGTPTAAGTFTVRLTATDTLTNSGSASYQLVIAPEPSTPQISTSFLNGGTRGVAYSSSVSASGGTTPYSWAATGLPAGLTIAATGTPTTTITGTPTASGAFTVSVTVTDSVGVPATAQFPLTIAATTPQINTTSPLLPGTQGAFYSFALSGSGGTKPYTWTIPGGGLPPGISLSGVNLTGTPTVPGTYTFTVILTDQQNLTAQATLSLTIATGLQIITPSIQPATVGQAYSVALTAALGMPPYSWSVPPTGGVANTGGAAPPTGGNSLPPGLGLSPNGNLSGSPTVAGNYTFTVQVTDNQGNSVQATYQLSVASAPPSQFDSLIISEQIELLGGSVPSTNPMCAGAIFKLQPGFDLNAPQPTTDIVASLVLDGERPFGYRASNRTITLPIMIDAPDFGTLAGAYEVLMQAIDQQAWTLTWTRKGSALPLVLDCYRAQPTVVQWGGVDQWNINPIGQVSLTFQALPYGRSDEPVSVAVASPIAGQGTTSSPVVLDGFSTVSGSNWVQSARHVVGPFSAEWDPSLAPINDPTGRGSAPGAVYSKNLPGTVNIVGLPALSVEAGFGTDYYSTWHKGPALFVFTLTDADGTTISFSRSLTVHASDDSTSPKWQRVTAAIPQGVPSFDYTQVAAYSVTVTNRKVNTLRYTKLYLDALTANPPSLQALPLAHGSMYSVMGVAGTARTSFAGQFQQPPGTSPQVSVTLPGPPGIPQTWTCPPGVTTATFELTGGGGAGGSQAGGSSNRCSGGGGGGEYAAATAVAVTGLKKYTYTLGSGGQPAANATGGAGGTSTITLDALTITAHGGGGGVGGVAAGGGGAGGTGSTAATHFNGGAGSAGVSNTSTGAGGGGAGSGGAGGAAAGTTPGAGGAGTTPGGAGSAGLTGSGDGTNAAAPGGGGSGAWQGNDAEYGGAGGLGQIKVTYTPTVAAFSTLIVHRPGPQAPESLSPIVSFGDTDVPNGTVEYPLQSLISGAYADFQGTYSVLVVATAWATPGTSRTVTLAVKQYEFAGGPSFTTSVARTFTPSTDVVNGIVDLGTLTLPLKDVAPDNSSGLYTVTITDTNTADQFADCLFLDSLGQTVMVNVPTAGAYVNYFIDEPTTDRDLGLVMGSSFGRAQAISVMDNTLISGGPLFLLPGDNLILCYCVEGAPALSVTYFPRWFLDRLA